MPELAAIFARLSALLGPREGEPEWFGAGLVSRKFKIRFGGKDYVVRLPRGDADKLGIDLNSGYVANLAAAELGIAPAVVSMFERPPCLVTHYVEGDAVDAATLREPEAIKRVAEMLHAFHASGAQLPVSSDPFIAVAEDDALSPQVRALLPDGYKVARSCARKIQRALRGLPEHEPVPCNSNLVPSSFLGTKAGVCIIDWQYAAMGDRFYDLGNFAANNELEEDGQQLLLGAYFGDDPPPRRLAALRLMCFMSDFREGIWGLVQSVDPEIDYPFQEYAQAHFDRLGGVASDPKLKRWLKEAAG